MLEMNFNPKEIESFIKSYYQDIRNISVNVRIENGNAIVSSEDEQIKLNSNDISFVVGEYFGSQNLNINNFSVSHDKENSTSIKVTQLNRGPIKKLA